MTLQASGLAGGRGARTLFSGIGFEIEAGEALRVEGRNGSGKTTLLRMVCGLVEPQAGEVRWRGQRVDAGVAAAAPWGARLLHIGHAAGIKDELSALENLRVAASLAGWPCSDTQARQALEAVGLRSRLGLPARSLSQGQRRRVQLARLALPASADVLVLDEPFNALDAESSAWLSEALSRRLDEGAVLVYTTHQDQTLRCRRAHRVQLGRREPVAPMRAEAS